MARRICSAVMSGTSAVLGGPKGTKAGRARAAWGCLLRSLVTVWALWFSKGGATRAAQARDSSPSPAKAQQRLCRARTTGSSESSGARRAGRRPRGRAWASKSSSRSPPSHRPHRRRVNCPACCRRRAPPRGAGRSTAFGSMSRSHQASAELWCATAARARARHWAHDARATLGTCRSTGMSTRKRAAISGPPPLPAAAAAAAGAAESRAAGRHRGWAPLNRAATRRPHTRQSSKLWAAQ